MRYLLLGLVPLLMTAQTRFTEAPAEAATPVADLATLEGRVVAGANGEPVPKATVTLTWAFPSQGRSAALNSYSAQTDSSGGFALRGVIPGHRYRLTVSRTGFLDLAYGARRPGQDGSLLSPSAREKIEGLTLRMVRAAAIAGHVSDADGQPAQGANVQLLAYRYALGRSGGKQLNNVGYAQVNDLGDFRLWGVAPGKYLLAVDYQNSSLAQVQDRSAVPVMPEANVRTYYPGTADPAGATQIEVTAGATVSGIGVTLLRAHTFHIGGRVQHSGLASPVQLNVSPRDPTVMGSMAMRFFFIPADSAGAFDVDGLAPGAYYVRGNGQGPRGGESGRVAVDIVGSNVEGVVLALTPPIEVAGQIRMEGDAAALTGIRLSATSPDDPFGNTVTAGPFKPDGSFKLSFALPGTYDVRANGLPEGSYVKSIRAGETDVLASGLTVGGAPPRVEVTVSPHAASLTGTVENADAGKPVEGAQVVLIPVEAHRRDRSLYYRSVSTDQRGTFVLRSVIPGEYKAYAWEDIEPGAYFDPAVVKPFEAQGRSVTIEADGHPALKLQVIPAEPPAATGAQR